MLSAPFFLAGCQVTYVVKSAYFQAGLLHSRVPVEKALENPALPAESKRKLKLAQDAIRFAVTDLGLKHTDNYSTFVQLDRPYVTYVVSAASRSELKPYLWWFPIVGSLPYKGFFDPESAKEEAEKLKSRGYDTFVRGVSAYSTLGWFSDPILSSMLNYKDHDLVDTVIHETTHATIYIKSQADFNERLAVFIGAKGAEVYYRTKEGPDSPTLKRMQDGIADERLFSAFIFTEMKALEKWYAERSGLAIPETERLARLKEIQARFAAEVRPRLRSAESYKNFESTEINNARLLTYRLYMENQDDFEAVFAKFGRDFRKMLEFCKTLEKVDDAKAELEKTARESRP